MSVGRKGRELSVRAAIHRVGSRTASDRFASLCFALLRSISQIARRANCPTRINDCLDRTTTSPLWKCLLIRVRTHYGRSWFVRPSFFSSTWSLFISPFNFYLSCSNSLPPTLQRPSGFRAVKREPRLREKRCTVREIHACVDVVARGASRRAGFVTFVG